MSDLLGRIAMGEEAIARRRAVGEPVPPVWEARLAQLKVLAGGSETGAHPAVPPLPAPQCGVEPDAPGTTYYSEEVEPGVMAVCPVCGAVDYWRSRYGVIVCGICHPPADPALVAEWMPPPKQQPADPGAGGHGGDHR